MNCWSNNAAIAPSTINLHSPFTPTKTLLFLHGGSGRPWTWRKRRRFKTNPRIRITNEFIENPEPEPLLSSSFVNLFHTLISQFPSLNSLDFITPALGFSSGLALYLSRFNSNSRLRDIGEWILFTSPTPFNRFVMLRCPSISFQGSELLEDVNGKLVKEDRHFVRLDTGRIQFQTNAAQTEVEKVKYQRLCVPTEDGGVISLDWPAHLDITEERGMDTTLLLIPGTPEGSMDLNVTSFVRECLRRGCFPLVMNPRGCAGSPLTTPRLFTAADSDDISTAIQFISRTRPWTTLMGVGWGYGANMLTKYLAEIGEATPLTAATCIDNPFDLEEATRSPPHHLALNEKLTSGLINILRSNKEIFQGRSKGFDVEKALLAKSIRDFEKEISMVSYGFETIEDFYSKSSTREAVGNNDGGAAPLFSIPRSLIAENPYTSLLLCSCLTSSAGASCRSAIHWCQYLTIEWLMAVELGLLKGRHPLLNDVEVTINPSKGLALVEGRRSEQPERVDRVLNLAHSNASIKKMLEGGDSVASSSVGDMGSFSKLEHEELEQKGSNFLQQISSDDGEKFSEEGLNSVDGDRGQVVDAAKVVLNMLEVTMPDTLTEEQKKKVLLAVGQGETFMKALQDAVPEDVRGKLTTAVSGILNSQGGNLNFDKLLALGRTPNASELKSKNKENFGTQLGAESGSKGSNISDLRKSADSLSDSSDNNQHGVDKSDEQSEPLYSEKLQKSADVDQSPSVSNHGEDIPSSGWKGANDSLNSEGNDVVSREHDIFSCENDQNGSLTGHTANYAHGFENTGQTEEANFDQEKLDCDSEMAPRNMKDNSTQKNGEKSSESFGEQSQTNLSTRTEEPVSPPWSLSEVPTMEKDGSDNQQKEDKGAQVVLDHIKSTQPDSGSPAFSVTQALDALTGMDDSTQVAVNSVFGVIEDMITQLEEEKVDGNGAKVIDKSKENKNASKNENQQAINESASKDNEGNTNNARLHSNNLYDDPEKKNLDNHLVTRHGSGMSDRDDKLFQSPVLFNGKSTERSEGVGHSDWTQNEKEDIGAEFLGENDSFRHLYDIPLLISANPHRNSIYNECLCKYLLLKMEGTNSLGLNKSSALFLDYFPEEGQWKLLEQPRNAGARVGSLATHSHADRKLPPKLCKTAKYMDIEPPYKILDPGKLQEPVGKSEIVANTDGSSRLNRSQELLCFVKSIILDSLRIEVIRRLSAADLEEMDPNITKELEEIANVVSLAVGKNKSNSWSLEGKVSADNGASGKVGTLHGDHFVKAMSSAVQKTDSLRRVLPIGVIVGSTLAAIRKYFNVTMQHDYGQNENAKSCEENHPSEVCETESDQIVNEVYQNSGSDNSITRDEIAASKVLNNETAVVGAITAALGASALLVNQQTNESGGIDAVATSMVLKEKTNQIKYSDKLEEVMSEKNQNNIVTSLAEKAMSVAGPVVPTKEDGEVDHERLVAMLADLGQKGGMLRLVGKIALLWGGIRGAMSLTDRLILFLHIADRPLYQRIIGFVCMVLLLWSPVVVPLLPSLMQSWSTQNSSKVAEFVSIIGLYAAVMILVMLWGKRIRGFENPLEQYGLKLTSSAEIKNLLMALIGGVTLVLSIHYLNSLLGCVHLSWPVGLPSSYLDAVMWLKKCGQMLFLACKGIATAIGVALVEELLFRSWLPEEIAADLGYHRGIIFSGLAFSLFQRSPWAIPGFWLLSLVLSGARQRNQGSLSIPIGLRAGILASSFILQEGGMLTSKLNFPLWVTGTHPLQPFSGAVGLALSLILAILFYPRQPIKREKAERNIQE
ncbi:Type II CAAX prenyl endopeptidase Rce1-like [Dillenia turbinata]|uniref:Type II CAAX prenyl endopeptidase Rce1-like n=1 Tax=Dillenia turbinata TaxID=194707 RepID=A0AAN8W1L0_9MAGN